MGRWVDPSQNGTTMILFALDRHAPTTPTGCSRLAGRGHQHTGGLGDCTYDDDDNDDDANDDDDADDDEMFIRHVDEMMKRRLDDR